MPLVDVVRAAIAEIEDMDRVDFAVDESLAVSGRGVADLTHLLAELIENAVHFSPPGVSVMLRTRPYQQAAGAQVLTIEDWGVGMTPAELADANDLLRRPPGRRPVGVPAARAARGRAARAAVRDRGGADRDAGRRGHRGGGAAAQMFTEPGSDPVGVGAPVRSAAAVPGRPAAPPSTVLPAAGPDEVPDRRPAPVGATRGDLAGAARPPAAAPHAAPAVAVAPAASAAPAAPAAPMAPAASTAPAAPMAPAARPPGFPAPAGGPYPGRPGAGGGGPAQEGTPLPRRAPGRHLYRDAATGAPTAQPAPPVPDRGSAPFTAPAPFAAPGDTADSGWSDWWARPGGGGNGRAPDPAPIADPVELPEPRPPADQVPAQAPAPARAAAPAAAPATGPAGGLAGGPAGGAPQLSRRVPQANLAAGLRRAPAAPAAAEPAAVRDPVAARDALSRFQASQRAARSALDEEQGR